MPNYSDWVSTLALLLGAGSVAWQAVTARREQPNISVDGQSSVERQGSQSWSEGIWALPVHVTNSGGQAVTVLAVYWELAGPSGPFRLLSKDMGPSLPLRLDALSADSWEVRVPIQGTLWAGVTARPAADVVLGKGLVTVRGAPSTLFVPDEEPGSTAN